MAKETVKFSDMASVEQFVDRRLKAARAHIDLIDKLRAEAIRIGYYELANDYDRQRHAQVKVIEELVEVKKRFGGGESE